MNLFKKTQKTNEVQGGDLLKPKAFHARDFSSLAFCLILLILTSIVSFPQTAPGTDAIKPHNTMLSCNAESTNHNALEKGFDYIFNGKDLTGWEGDPSLWSVRDGCIVGETTEILQIKGSSFLTWTNGIIDDFELKLCFKIEGINANSGIQYRSKYLPEQGKWKLGGYQADFDADNEYTGILYEASGRGVMTKRGEKVILLPDKKSQSRKLNKSGNSPPHQDNGLIKTGQWYEYRIIAKEYNFIHIINNQLTVDVIDKDKINRARKGLLGFQLHDGHPMKVEFKNIRLKKLNP